MEEQQVVFEEGHEDLVTENQQPTKLKQFFNTTIISIRLCYFLTSESLMANGIFNTLLATMLKHRAIKWPRL